MPNIVVIDDDPDFRDYLALLLERAGHAVRTLPNGAGLRAVVSAHRVDAVITDLYMPEQDGIETVRQLRAIAPDMPVIAVSGSSVANDPCLRAIRLMGAAAVIGKPV